MDRFVILRPAVSLKESPEMSAETVDEALYGMTGTIDEQALPEGQGEWIKVCMEYGYEGYVTKSSLLVTKEGLPAGLRENHPSGRSVDYEECLVAALFADILISPDIRSAIVMTLPRGSRVILSEPLKAYSPYEDDWVLLVSPRGFIRRSHIRPVSFHQTFHRTNLNETVIRQNIVRDALSYLGVSYRWGGKSPMGIDCSGLSFMTYFLNGVIIYRDAKLKEGYPVTMIPFAEAGPGDLLYFPGHIAIYLGEGRFVHSTARGGSDGVVINSFCEAADDYRGDLKESFLYAGSVFYC